MCTYLINNKIIDKIFQEIIEGKKILVVGNYNELQDILSCFKEYSHNSITEKTIIDKLNSLDKNICIDEIEMEKIFLLKRCINNIKYTIINIFNTFTSTDKNNYSLNYLYYLTNERITFNKKDFNFYNIISKSSIITENEERKVTSTVSNLLSSNLIQLYIKYRKFNDNKRFEIVKEPINSHDIITVLNKLNGILNNKFAFIPPLYYNEYTKEFLDNNIYTENYSKDKLRKLVRKINFSHNSSIINSIKKIHWYEFIKFNYYKKVIMNNKLYYNKYITLEDNIYNQYLENIENLTLFSTSFTFLNKVFTDNVVKKLDSLITNEDELYNFILNIKNTLVTYNNYLTIESTIKSLDAFEIEILNYFYDKLSIKKNLTNILNYIPKFYLYRSIEAIEATNEKYLLQYSNISEKLSTLFNSLNTYSIMFSDALNKITTKNLYNFVKNNKIDLKYNNNYYGKYPYENNSDLNNKLLWIAFPLYFLSTDEYIANKDNYIREFDSIINCSDPNYECKLNKDNENSFNIDYIQKEIFKILSQLKCNFDILDNNIFLIHNDDMVNNDKVLYINNNNRFGNKDLVKLYDLIKDKNKEKILFIWSRDLWIDRNYELKRIYDFVKLS